MKNKTLFGAMLCLACTVSMNAQLRVINNGNVGIHLADTVTPLSQLAIGNGGINNASLSVYKNGLLTGETYYGQYSYVTTSVYNATEYAFSGVCRGKALTKIGIAGDVTGGINSQARSYGVFGATSGSTSGYNYGVYGLLKTGNSTHYGAGVFGSNEEGEIPAVERLAGYFRGRTRVVGDFFATTVNTTSDARLKTNVANVNKDILVQINKLRPIQFNWQQIEYSISNDTTSAKTTFFSKDTEFDRKHYGFLAQEVQKLFPELVHEDGEGYLSINYVELIPLLAQSIQELSAEVEELKKSNAATPRIQKKNDIEQAILYQNNPNPFSVDTKIAYLLPVTSQKASLYIYNMNGLQVAEYSIYNMGEGFVTVSAGTLKAGMYLYSLIADGQVVDTKRMILTK